ncbi:hypothetical protein [Algibacter sp. 2305UL17-15]|uniref:hypothetical protein n=1 Tax=Algibacter sp. 2305UL17-15 TaxID=3231268 RepID=UPI0034584F57
MNTIETILEKIERAKELDFGSIFNNNIELFKKVWLQGFVTMILTGLLVVPFYFIMYIPLVAIGLISPETLENGEMPSVALIIAMVIIVTLFFLVVIIVSIGMRSAFYRICKNKDFNDKTSDDYFFFFKKKYFKKTIILGLSIAGITVLSLLLFILPVFYVMIPLAYMPVIYAVNPDLTPNEIIKAGFALGNKKWFFTLLLLIVSWFVSLIGLLMCLIGIYFTQQFVLLPFYEVYKQMVGFSHKSEIDTIGSGEL